MRVKLTVSCSKERSSTPPEFQATMLTQDASDPRVPTWLIAIIAAVLLATTGFAAHRALHPPLADPPLTDEAPVALPGWREYATGGNRIGTAARDTVIVFSDFQCPFCRAFAKTIRTVQRDSVSALLLIFHHFPLPQHTLAFPAAVAAICADRQHRFAAMHDALFASPQDIGFVSWSEFAHRAAVADVHEFEICVQDRSADSTIKADIALGQQLRVHATPTIIVNGWRFVGAPTPRALAAALSKPSLSTR